MGGEGKHSSCRLKALDFKLWPVALSAWCLSRSLNVGPAALGSARVLVQAFLNHLFWPGSLSSLTLGVRVPLVKGLFQNIGTFFKKIPFVVVGIYVCVCVGTHVPQRIGGSQSEDNI